ncbi:hypothetical protein EJE23_16025 [Enterobacter chengduensis]|nr:hypothetical protein EJE23_16025 [Enterobacter chengduensis]
MGIGHGDVPPGLLQRDVGVAAFGGNFQVITAPGGASLTGPTGAKCRPGKAQPPPGKSRRSTLLPEPTQFRQRRQ